ncbi:g11796 [Coccomyxa elongata]
MPGRALLVIALATASFWKTQCAPLQPANIHTVVPVECTHGYFEWQVIGLAYSFKRAGQPGPLTRLMSCSEEQLKDYKWLDLMPTYVAPNMAHDKVHDDWYQPYNKPTAIDYWLRDMKPMEEFIMVIDADSILRMPFYPERFNVTRGWAYSPYFMELLEGVQNALALRHVPDVAPRQDWFAGNEGRRADKVGPPYLMHREDMERVAPLWYNFTYAVRNDPLAWNLTGDTSIKEPGGKTWISEMYGYSFAAAAANVWHRQVDYAANLVPGNGPIGPPMVLHYGNDLAVNNTAYNFSKIRVREAEFDPTLCPPWDLAHKPGREVAAGGLLPYPPSPLSLPSQGLDLLRDLLSVEPAIVLNAAFCDRHKRKCSPSKQLEEECSKVAQQEKELDEAYDAVEKILRATECNDSTPDCTGWTNEGMCHKNPRYMHFGCRASCGTCFQPDLQVRWHGPQAQAGGQITCADLRARQATLTDYDLDYDHSFFGDIPDPCSGDSEAEGADEASQEKQAASDKVREVPSADAHGQTERVAGAASNVGGDGAQAAGAATVGADNMQSGGASDAGSGGAQAAEAPALGANKVQSGGAAKVFGASTQSAGGAESGGGGGSAVGTGGGLSTVKARVTEALAARDAVQGVSVGSGIGGVHSVGGGLEEGREGGNAIGEERKLLLSQRMRVSIRSASGDRGDRHARSAASVKVLVEILDWVGVVSIWCCVVAMFLMFLRRPWGRPVLAGQRSLSRPLMHEHGGRG